MPYLLPLFITSFLETYPQVSLSVEEFISEQIVHKLKHNGLDAGILVTPLDLSDVDAPGNRYRYGSHHRM